MLKITKYTPRQVKLIIFKQKFSQPELGNVGWSNTQCEFMSLGNMCVSELVLMLYNVYVDN